MKIHHKPRVCWLIRRNKYGQTMTYWVNAGNLWALAGTAIFTVRTADGTWSIYDGAELVTIGVESDAAAREMVMT